MKKKKVKNPNWAKNLIDLVPGFFALAMATTAIGIAANSFQKMFAEEIKQRSDEFKLMNVIEIEKRDKNKTVIEYHNLKGIKNYIKSFLKRNPKWKSEDEDYCGMKTGRIILTRIYRNYHKKTESNNSCPECGRDYEED
jgi:hypothetical protein